MFKDIEQAYMHDFSYDNIQDFLKDNHANIFYKNHIQQENPFICGVAYGMLTALINSNICTNKLPVWLYNYVKNYKDRFITCIDDSAIKWAKNFACKANRHLSMDCNRFTDGEALFLDFFHNEYTFNQQEESRLFQNVEDVAPTFDMRLDNKIAIFLD